MSDAGRKLIRRIDGVSRVVERCCSLTRKHELSVHSLGGAKLSNAELAPSGEHQKSVNASMASALILLLVAVCVQSSMHDVRSADSFSLSNIQLMQSIRL